MNTNSLPRPQQGLNHIIDTIELNFSADGALTVTPQEGSLHEGQNGFQERAEDWVSELTAILKPAQLVQLNAMVPATGSFGDLLPEEGAADCIDKMRLCVGICQLSQWLDEGASEINAQIASDIQRVTEDMADVRITISVTTPRDPSWSATEFASRNTFLANLANELTGSVKAFYRCQTAWLLASGIRSLTLDLLPEHPLRRGRKLKAAKKTLMRLVQ